MKRRTTYSLLIGVLISLTALVVVIRWAGWSELLEALTTVDWRYFIAGIAVFLMSMLARGLSWRNLLSKQYSLLRVIAVLNEGYLINHVLPWRLGEVGRALLLAGGHNDSVMRVFSSILMERLLDVSFALIFLLVMLPAAAGLEGFTQNATFIGVAFLIIAVIVMLAIQRPGLVKALISRLPWARDRLLGIWEQIQAGFAALRDPRIFVTSAFWMLVSWILAGIEYSLIVKAVIPDASWRWGFFMLPVTLLGGAIPSTPGYIGVFEAAGVLALSVFGVPESRALAATLLLHGIFYILGSGFGLIALLNEGETIASLMQRLLSWRQPNSPLGNHEDPS